VRQSLRDFSLNQAEYEWSVLTYALMLDDETNWMTTEGQRMNFDRLAKRIMRQEMPQGVCFGNHRLYTLTILLRVDELSPQRRIIAVETRTEISDYLAKMTARLSTNQHHQGFWNAKWPDETPSTSEPTETDGDRLADRILATGHALEWWAMAPRELHPPRDVLARAGQWLVLTIESLSDAKIEENFTFLSHAGRALALWRGKEPADVELTPSPRYLPQSPSL
jgi:hypothetical protein